MFVLSSSASFQFPSISVHMDVESLLSFSTFYPQVCARKGRGTNPALCDLKPHSSGRWNLAEPHSWSSALKRKTISTITFHSTFCFDHTSHQMEAARGNNVTPPLWQCLRRWSTHWNAREWRPQPRSHLNRTRISKAGTTIGNETDQASASRNTSYQSQIGHGDVCPNTLLGRHASPRQHNPLPEAHLHCVCKTPLSPRLICRRVSVFDSLFFQLGSSHTALGTDCTRSDLASSHLLCCVFLTASGTPWSRSAVTMVGCGMAAALRNTRSLRIRAIFLREALHQLFVATRLLCSRWSERYGQGPRNLACCCRDTMCTCSWTRRGRTSEVVPGRTQVWVR